MRSRLDSLTVRGAWRDGQSIIHSIKHPVSPSSPAVLRCFVAKKITLLSGLASDTKVHRRNLLENSAIGFSNLGFRLYPHYSQLSGKPQQRPKRVECLSTVIKASRFPPCPISSAILASPATSPPSTLPSPRPSPSPQPFKKGSADVMRLQPRPSPSKGSTDIVSRQPCPDPNEPRIPLRRLRPDHRPRLATGNTQRIDSKQLVADKVRTDAQGAAQRAEEPAARVVLERDACVDGDQNVLVCRVDLVDDYIAVSRARGWVLFFRCLLAPGPAMPFHLVKHTAFSHS